MKARSNIISNIISNLDIGLQTTIETDNISAWRESFSRRLLRYNQTCLPIDKKFSISRDKDAARSLSQIEKKFFLYTVKRIQ